MLRIGLCQGHWALAAAPILDAGWDSGLDRSTSVFFGTPGVTYCSCMGPSVYKHILTFAHDTHNHTCGKGLANEPGHELNTSSLRKHALELDPEL